MNYRIAIGLCLFIISIGLGVLFYVDHSLPLKQGKIDLPGIEKPVKVIRDKFGIPHIEASSEEEAWYALGFVMASERLFQMDLLRRAASGTLSEVFGEKTVKVDVLMRSLRLRQTMEEFWERKQQGKINTQMLLLATKFYDGVHAYMENFPLPPEFTLLGYKPQRFDVVDAMAVSGYMALTFAEGLVGDILFSELLDEMPPELVSELRVGIDQDKYFKQARYSEKKKSENSSLATEIQQAVAVLEELIGLFHGSNSWVMAPHRSQSGKAILANDPHISLSNPHIFYEAHIKSPTQEIYGHFLPLVPFPVLGHNRSKGWALTMSEIDDLDIYLEKINPENSDQVMYKNEWVELKKEHHTIKVKGGTDYSFTLKISPHGPILDSTKYGEGRPLALKWTYHHPENNVIETFYGLLRAKNLEEYKQALSHAAAPGLNISWADAEGNIAWWMVGKIPNRPVGMRSDILLQGHDGTQEYQGYLDISENPHLVNPENGIIVSANYKPLDAKYSHIDGYWQPSDRYERLTELLEEKDTWSLEDLKQVQTDHFMYVSREMLPILLAEIREHTHNLNLLEKKALPFVGQWTGESDFNSVGSSVFHMWIHYIGKFALIDQLGQDKYEAFGAIADYWHFFKQFIKNPNSPFWDDVKTQPVESRSNIIAKAYRKAIHELATRMGKSPEHWQWGRLHQVTWEHPIGKQAPFHLIFNIGPKPAKGGAFQVNNLAYKRYLNTFSPAVGPATRRLVDFANPVESWGIIPTGNSGHFFSPHFSDQADLYLNDQYRPQLMDLKKVKQGQYWELTLI